jgi:hypothetical protein
VREELKDQTEVVLYKVILYKVTNCICRSVTTNDASTG